MPATAPSAANDGGGAGDDDDDDDDNDDDDGEKGEGEEACAELLLFKALLSLALLSVPDPPLARVCTSAFTCCIFCSML